MTFQYRVEAMDFVLKDNPAEAKVIGRRHYTNYSKGEAAFIKLRWFHFQSPFIMRVDIRQVSPFSLNICRKKPSVIVCFHIANEPTVGIFSIDNTGSRFSI